MKDPPGRWHSQDVCLEVDLHQDDGTRWTMAIGLLNIECA